MTTPEAEQSQSAPVGEPAPEQTGAEVPSAAGAVAGDGSASEGTQESLNTQGTGADETGGPSAGSQAADPRPTDLRPADAHPADAHPADTATPRPEERLERAVRAAEQALIEYEIAVDTFRIEVENFSRLHHQKLGPMYARLDELDARIAEAKAARTGDPEDIRKADEARARVMPMPAVEELFHGWMDGDGLFPEAAAMLTDQPVRPPQRVRPSEEARKLYRELARKAHPDLAQDDDERKRREEFITRVNAAYSRGDAPLLRELAEEWAAGPAPAERGPSPSEELYARLEWLAQRKELLTLVARELEEGAIGSMLRIAPDDPDRLLDEIAEQLLAQVAEREAELAALLGEPGTSEGPSGSVGA
ncbi:J domain-containing protein [Streptomyces graminifolii]|uniref:J domain-containing protein n=1 Tax=Streptomyces graminifolii TaxID=1266771 RepID=UPI0040598642